MTTRRHIATRIAAVAALSIATVLIAAGAASAHVKVTGIDVTQGGYGVLTFRVPSESDTLSTTEIDITFPKDTPIASVSLQPKAGWTGVVTTAKLDTPIATDDGEIDTYVSQVTFTADDAASAIPPQEFDMFNLSVGPLPTTPTVSFPTLQTYSDGSTVDWSEQSANGTEPEHPAPTLALPAVAAVGSDSGAASAAPDTAGTPTTVNGTEWTGFAGLVAGVLALIIAIIALVRVRPPSDSTPSSPAPSSPAP
ncbi:MAG TPA: YcnI family protein [Pseudolysinimonas sp.]